MPDPIDNAEFATELAASIAGFHAGTLTQTQLQAAIKTQLDSWDGTPFTPANIALKVTQIMSAWSYNVNQTRDWWAGTATGGFKANGDPADEDGGGYYPLTDGQGFTIYVASPALIATVGYSAESIAALPVYNPVAEGNERMVMFQGGVPVAITFIPSRRSADFAEIQKMLGTEVFPALTSAGVEGTIAAKEVHRLFSGGIINPKMPPYNCKGDLQETRAGCDSTAGQDRIHIEEPMFKPEDEGKLLYLSNAGPGGLQMETTILRYIDANTVQMADNASTTFFSQRIMWGSDDTEGLRQAMLDCQGPGLTTYGACCLLPPGMYLIVSLQYYRLSALVGYGPRTSVLCAMPTNDTDPLLYNHDDQVDFPNIQNIGINGMAYYQRTGRYGGMQFISVTGAEGQQLPQTDPCPFFAHIHLWDNNYTALYTYGRHSGTHIGVETFTNWGFGWQNAAYDVNAMNFLAIGNWFSGYMSQSANCNLANAKISFNGSNAYDVGFGVEPAQANMLELGTGNQYTNCRLQESNGCNLWIAGGWNEWDNLGIDDTGCMGPAHGQASSTPDVRAAVMFGANTAIDNSVKFKAGRAVHPDVNYMTHAIFYRGDASRNIVDGRTRYQTADTTWPGITYAPIGTDSSGGLGSTNVGTLDRVNIHDAAYGSL